MSNRPTPFILAIVATGATHNMQFKAKVSATVAYRKLRDALTSPAATYHEVEDDYGALCIVDLREVKSIRLVDVNAEQSAAEQMKISEVYGALSFQDYVKEHHPAVMLARAGAMPGQQGMIGR